MATAEPQSKLQRWGIDTLILGVGGAAASFATLLLTSLIFGRDSRIASGVPTSLLVALALVGVLAFFLIRKRYAGCLPCAIVIGWWGAHFLLTLIASTAFRAQGMPLVAYLVVWLIIGALGAAFIGASPRGKLALAGGAGALGAAGYAATRQSGVLKSSGYGRIEPATVILLTQHVRTANDAANQLPPNAPASVRKIAVGVVLDFIIRDWWENENREGLSPTDAGDMGAFVQFAWTCARGAGSLPEAESAFRAVLNAMMDNWFAEWNADGVDGAPRWQWNG